MDKFKKLDDYLSEKRACYDWHGEEYYEELQHCDETDVNWLDEVRKAFIAGFDACQKETL